MFKGHVIVSGKKRIIEIFSKNLKKKRRKGIILPVSAPFHSSLMKKAADNMKSKIEKTNFLAPKPNIISNVTAKEENEVEKCPPKIREDINWQIVRLCLLYKCDVADEPRRVVIGSCSTMKKNRTVMLFDKIVD